MIKSVSKSSLKMFYRCPEQWRRRYVDGEIIPPAIALCRGGSIHKAAEVNHKQKIETCVDLPVSDLQDAARDHYFKTIRQDGVFIPKDQVSEKNTLLNDGLNAAIRLTGLYHAEIAPLIQPALVEEKLEIDIGLAVPIVGIVDVYTIDKRLPDFKSSDKSPSEGAADVSLDLTFYAGLVASATGEWPLEVSLDYLVDLKGGPKYVQRKSKRGQTQWRNLLLRVDVMLKQVQAGIFPPCDSDSWACGPRWCGYFWTCKYAVRN